MSGLSGAKSNADVFALLGSDAGPGNRKGFWMGDGAELMGALSDAGWSVVRADSDYYWVMQAPNGDLLTNVEGDLYSGNSLMPQESSWQPGVSASDEEKKAPHAYVGSGERCRLCGSTRNHIVHTSKESRRRVAAEGKCPTCGKDTSGSEEWSTGQCDDCYLEDHPTEEKRSMRKGAPFADYKDFADCVSKNQDADDPDAYCGYIKHKVEDNKESKVAHRLSAKDLAVATRELRRFADHKTEGPYKVQVAGSGENVWSENALRFDTPEEARAYASDLLGRWFGADMARVVSSDTPTRSPVDKADPQIVINYRTGMNRQARFAEAFTDELHRMASAIRQGDKATCKQAGNPSPRKGVADSYKLECYSCGKKGTIEDFGMGHNRQCPSCGSYEVHSPDAHTNWKSKGSSRHTARSLSEIASEIARDWRPPNYAAVPYLDAMRSLDSMSDNYGAESAKGIVAYFLSNSSTWRGETAKRIKAELKAMQKGGARLVVAQAKVASNYYLDMIEDANGDLVDIEYYHRFCAPDDLKAKGDWPAPEWPDSDVYCAGCGELIHEGISSEGARQANTDTAEADPDTGTVVRDPRNPRGLYGGERNILLQDRALDLHDEEQRDKLELRQLEQSTRSGVRQAVYGPVTCPVCDTARPASEYIIDGDTVRCPNCDAEWALEDWWAKDASRQAARSDYAHWNEDADYMWYQEEGRFPEEPPEYDDDPYDGPDADGPEVGDEALCEHCGDEITFTVNDEWIDTASSSNCPLSPDHMHLPDNGGGYMSDQWERQQERKQMGLTGSRNEGGTIAHPDPDGGISSRDAGPYIQEGWEGLVDSGLSPEEATDRMHSLPEDDYVGSGGGGGSSRSAGWIHDFLNFGNPDKWGEVHWEEGDSIEDAPTIEQWRKDHGKDAANQTSSGWGH